MTEPLPWPDKTDRLIFDELDSTMAEAARIGPDLKRPTWIMARHQTAGRGRRGRAWANPTGHFAATYVYRPSGTAAEGALRSFFAANAVFEALAMKVERDRLSLKWPNDVLLRGGKVAGILLETVGTGGQPSHLAIGIGVNLAAAPDASEVEDGAVPPVALKSALGIAIGPEEFLPLLATAYARHEDQFRTFGFAPIHTAWLAHAARLGQVITARTTRDTYVGTFVDVDAEGQLVLETPRGRITIPAGDVYF